MSEWVWQEAVHCPHCMAQSLWGCGSIHVCVACNWVMELKMYAEWAQSSQERELVKEARHAASVDSNSAVGAFS